MSSFAAPTPSKSKSSFLSAKSIFTPKGSSTKATDLKSKSTPRVQHTRAASHSARTDLNSLSPHPLELHANPSKSVNPRIANHRATLSTSTLHAPDNPHLDSEAAEALRENARVKISKLGKVLKKKGKVKKEKNGAREVYSDSELTVDTQHRQLTKRRSFSTSLKSSNVNPPKIPFSFSISSTTYSEVAGVEPLPPPEKKKNKRRNRKKKSKKDKDRTRSYVKGNVIDARHELYTLSIAMMLGLDNSIREGRGEELLTVDSPMAEAPEDGCSPSAAGCGKVPAPIALFTTGTGMALEAVVNVATTIQSVLTPSDFKATGEVMFPPRGSYDGGIQLTPPHNLSHTFKFKSFAPSAFTSLRSLFGITTDSYLASICGNTNFIEFVSNAKSGQFFFYSHDGKYIIKTMSKPEAKFLLKILPAYHAHVSKNPETLITKYMGMYKVKMYHLNRNVRFVVMKSVFDTDVPLEKFYDLKGSVLGRKAKVGESVLKDNDLRDLIAAQGFGFAPLDQNAYLQMRATLVSDLDFFKKMNIIDYSMLVGVGTELKRKLGARSRSSSLEVSDADVDLSSDESRASPTQTKDNSASAVRSDMGYPIRRANSDPSNSTQQLAYFGIIDILQPYTPFKRIESLSKSVFSRGGRGAVSCVEPDFYGERFLKFFDVYMKGEGEGEMPAGEVTSEDEDQKRKAK
ncbi:hypothetical protein TrLO_g1539 [Triparma laevis f. longispina]|uniref:PIPK domain-containing protein n=1 Tax=Triparma laevis f. longispina TaxID=1714387 RepID=A0A9W7FTM7_9STRA|nr:hypothetical protein TrLO_g1539 [Triparma laevis f. longispina]